MKCDQCGTPIKPDDKFCRECGIPLKGKESEKASEETAIEREALLAQFKKGKEFLGEHFSIRYYDDWSLPELKKEYFKLFERVMQESAKRMKKLEGD